MIGHGPSVIQRLMLSQIKSRKLSSCGGRQRKTRALFLAVLGGFVWVLLVFFDVDMLSAVLPRIQPAMDASHASGSVTMLNARHLSSYPENAYVTIVMNEGYVEAARVMAYSIHNARQNTQSLASPSVPHMVVLYAHDLSIASIAK